MSDEWEYLRDLSPTEWEQAKEALAAADLGVDDNTIMVRSHVWPSADVDGPSSWLIYIPGTKHAARGTSPSIDAAFGDMNVHLALWYPGISPEESTHVLRFD